VGCIASLQGQPEALDPCAGLAASLSRLRLIDEYRLYLHPVVLGGGKPFFEAGTSLKLRPLGVESLASLHRLDGGGGARQWSPCKHSMLAILK
jgi:hypothetical protein